jgi:hypothetical protein
MHGHCHDARSREPKIYAVFGVKDADKLPHRIGNAVT